jgi:F0F1-type ATP synthase delta subunit
MTITTAYDADKETIGQLQNWIQKELKGSVNVRHQKDVSIIGGFIADVDFNRWDASVRTQLSEIKRKLS